MPNPIVIAHHLIWTAYGWWLPNDPRGSGSTTIRNDVIAELGDVHLGRKKVQPVGKEVREFYEKAHPLLQHPALTFDEVARNEIAASFAEVIAAEKYTCYACAIMPDHVHILVRKHKHLAEQMIDNLKSSSRLRLSASSIRTRNHPTWTGGRGWKVFLDHPDEIRRTIPYIENIRGRWGCRNNIGPSSNPTTVGPSILVTAPSHPTHKASNPSVVIPIDPRWRHCTNTRILPFILLPLTYSQEYARAQITALLGTMSSNCIGGVVCM